MLGSLEDDVSEQREGGMEARIAALEAELAQAKKRETAIGEVRRVISRSPADMHSVVRAMLGRALQLLGAENGALALRRPRYCRLACETFCQKRMGECAR